MKIEKFRLSYNANEINFIIKRNKEILKNGFISEGKFVKSFEEKFSKFLNCKYSIFVGSGTDALDIAFRMVDKKKIIVQANTFFAAEVALENSNKIGIYCDMELDDFGIDINHLKQLLEKNKNKVGAVCIVHLGGKISKNILKIKSLCKENKVLLIEDSAHSHGSKFKHYSAGTIGDIGCFSFYPNKVMTTGEGGMLVTNNKRIYKKMLSLKNFGRTKNEFLRTNNGINSKVTENQAIMGLLEIRRVINRLKKRNSIAKIYDSFYKNTESKIICDSDNSFCSYYKYIVLDQIVNIYKLKRFLEKNDIYLSGQTWSFSLDQQPKYLNNVLNDLKNTNIFTKNHYCLPIYPELNLLEAKQIITKIKEFYISEKIILNEK